MSKHLKGLKGYNDGTLVAEYKELIFFSASIYIVLVYFFP